MTMMDPSILSHPFSYGGHSGHHLGGHSGHSLHSPHAAPLIPLFSPPSHLTSLPPQPMSIHTSPFGAVAPRRIQQNGHHNGGGSGSGGGGISNGNGRLSLVYGNAAAIAAMPFMPPHPHSSQSASQPQWLQQTHEPQSPTAPSGFVWDRNAPHNGAAVAATTAAPAVPLTPAMNNVMTPYNTGMYRHADTGAYTGAEMHSDVSSDHSLDDASEYTHTPNSAAMSSHSLATSTSAPSTPSSSNVDSLTHLVRTVRSSVAKLDALIASVNPSTTALIDIRSALESAANRLTSYKRKAASSSTDEYDETDLTDAVDEVIDDDPTDNRTACKPCPLVPLNQVNKKPIKVLYVNVQRQYTLSKKETLRMSREERERLVPVHVRIMGNALKGQLYFVAKDVCLLIHTRKGNVAKSIGQFAADEKVRMSVVCPRSNGTVSTHVLTALTLKGVRRLLTSSRSALAPLVLKWILKQIEELMAEAKSVTDEDNKRRRHSASSDSAQNGDDDIATKTEFAGNGAVATTNGFAPNQSVNGRYITGSPPAMYTARTLANNGHDESMQQPSASAPSSPSVPPQNTLMPNAPHTQSHSQPNTPLIATTSVKPFSPPMSMRSAFSSVRPIGAAPVAPILGDEHETDKGDHAISNEQMEKADKPLNTAPVSAGAASHSNKDGNTSATLTTLLEAIKVHSNDSPKQNGTAPVNQPAPLPIA